MQSTADTVVHPVSISPYSLRKIPRLYEWWQVEVPVKIHLKMTDQCGHVIVLAWGGGPFLTKRQSLIKRKHLASLKSKWDAQVTDVILPP